MTRDLQEGINREKKRGTGDQHRLLGSSEATPDFPNLTSVSWIASGKPRPR